MSSTRTRSGSVSRLLAICGSAGLLAYLVWHTGATDLWRELVKLGWRFAFVFALAGAAHLVKTLAWRMTLGRDRHKISLPKLVGLRLGAEAAGQLGILGQTFGDSIRVSHLSSQIRMAQSLASVTLDRGLYFVSATTVTAAGLLTVLPMLSTSGGLQLYAGLFAFGSIVILLLILFTIRRRLPLLSEGARLMAHLPRMRPWIDRRFHLILSMENALFDFYHDTPRLFWGSLLLNLAAQCLAILEVCLVLWLFGVHVSLLGCTIIEALTKLVNALGSFNPGNIGTYESGNLLIGKLFSLPSTTGLALALTRRLRALSWTAVGCICLGLLTRSKELKDSGTIEKNGTAKNSDAHVETANKISSGCLAFAVFLPPTDTRVSSAKVGTLPIPLRIILNAHRTSPAQIIVVADAEPPPNIRQELARTGRLPESVQWLEVKANAPLRERLLLVATSARTRRLVLVDGGTTYHPVLIRRAVEWSHKVETFAPKSASVPAGLYALPTDALGELIRLCPIEARNLEELHESFARHGIAPVNVSEDLWQKVRTESDRRFAESKLNRWLIKPTDGMYARLNRKVSIPISRLLVKLTITANMVSILTLAVGAISAIFFALGGYSNTLLGAFLCLFASILDGCDGEVARLKLLESDFGCWLETICDYVFYFLLLIGVTIGQWRSSGSDAYLVWGALLLVGAFASFVAVGWQRRQLAAGRPEEFLSIWQSHAEKRSSNPILYAARHMEFLVRRCFFPYALVAFALLGIMKVAFVLSVIGANLVWPIALYSSCVLSSARGAAAAVCNVPAEPRPDLT